MLRGEMMFIVGVVFKDYGSTLYFNCENKELKVNDYVIVNSNKGELFGKVISLDCFTDDISGNIIRIATSEDYDVYLNNCKLAKQVLSHVKKVAKEMNLNMSFVDASYNFDKTQLLINFTSDERVDFRDLVKKIAYKYKTRIDLRQIGVRDKAKKICGLGQCGKELCCGSFLDEFVPVSISMAKNQGIALNPNKINGACGRLLCCLSYEDDVYTENKSLLPKIGSSVIYNDKSYKVQNVNVLSKSYIICVDNELKEIFVDEG